MMEGWSLLPSLTIPDAVTCLLAALTGMAVLSQACSPLTNLTRHGKVLQQSSPNDQDDHTLIHWLVYDDYWMVPKQRFTQFYMMGILSFSIQLLTGMMTQSQTHAKEEGWSSATTIAWTKGLFLLHLVRRLYECRHVHRWQAQSRMHWTAYILGLLYYAVVPWLWWSQLSRSSFDGVAEECTTMIGPLRISWVLLCVWAQYQQYRHHGILAELRRRRDRDAAEARSSSSYYYYGLPQGGWFSQVACPHYLAEILLYVGIVGVWGDWYRGGVLLGWVITTLTINALTTHRWYHQQIPGYAALHRKALFPHVL